MYVMEPIVPFRFTVCLVIFVEGFFFTKLCSANIYKQEMFMVSICHFKKHLLQLNMYRVISINSNILVRFTRNIPSQSCSLQEYLSCIALYARTCN